MDAITEKVSDVMSHDLVTIERNDTLLAADGLMIERGVRHLLVVDGDGNLAGVLSRRDLFRPALRDLMGFGSTAQDKLLETLRVKDAMQSPAITTAAQTPLRDAARILIEKRIGCLPVLEGEKLVGILTEGDFVRLAAR